MANPYYDERDFNLRLIDLGSGGVPGEVAKINRKLIKGFDKVFLDMGVAGAPTNLSYTLNAETPISGHRAVRRGPGGGFVYADASVLADRQLVLGVSLNAALVGQPVLARTEGLIVEGSWSWTPGEPIYCGLNGVLTQTFSPSWAWSRILGVALSPTSMWVKIRDPLIL